MNTLTSTEGSIKDESDTKVVLKALQFPVYVKLSTALCGPTTHTARQLDNF